MMNKIIGFFRAPVFPDDPEKTRRAQALNALHINMGGAMLVLGALGILFAFSEKRVTTLILISGMLILAIGMMLNRRGFVKASAILILTCWWVMTVFMTSMSGGIRSLDTLFFVSGTVAAGIMLGAGGGLFYAILSLLTGLALVLAENMGIVFPVLFTFPPASAWIILFINLAFTVAPLQVTLQSLSDSASLARSELAERKNAEARVQQSAAHLEILHEIDRALLSAHTLEEIAMGALTRIRKLIPCSRASLTLFDIKKNEARFLATSFDNADHNMGKDVITLQEYGQYIIDELELNRACRVTNVLTDPRANELDKQLAEAGFLAWLYLPLHSQGQLIGALNLGRGSDMPFTKREENLATDVANQLAIAIQQTRLYDALQNELEQRKKLIAELELRNAESETLRESAAIVAATLERSEAIDRILEQLARVVPYNSASVQLVNGDTLEIVSTRGLEVERRDVGTRFEINANEPAYPVLHGDAPYILYEDVQISIPEFNEIPHNNIHAWMAIPLKVKGRNIGIIALDGQKAGQFSDRDAMLAVTYANQVAIALENARLFTELQSELAIRQKLIDELENKNAELERFSYTVSHDLRSPLVTIKGFLGYLERDAKSGNMEGFYSDLRRIGSAADRMDILLKDLLELSRIGRLINEPREVPFGDLVRDAVEIVHGRLEARGITLQILSPQGVQPNLPTVFGDEPRLVEVLQNLIDNAAKYMGNQKNPIIEIGTDGCDELGNPVFFVRDNGMGIAFEYHERIFGLFEKLDAVSEGAGVGLALVKRIIEFHGGRIWIESEAGRGSTFYFTLPRPGSQGSS